MEQVPQPPDEGTTLELLARVQDGDQEAWRDLYRLYHDELLFSIRQKLGPRLRAVMQSEDVFQSVALEAFRDLPRFEHRGQGSLRAFLHRLVINKIRDRADWFGAQKRRGGAPLTDSLAERVPTPTAELRYHDNERFDRLERCLSALPENMREIIVLRRIEGLTSKEAADRLSKSDEAARKLYSRAIARLSLLMREAEAT